MKKITIIIPAYNEEESLPFLYERLDKLMGDMKNYDFEILFVNDGSKDKTISIIKELREKDKRISYVDFSRNFGKEIAMIAGLDYATGDCVIFIDADLQDPPELIVDMYKKSLEGYDIVYGKRLKRDKETAFKKLTAYGFYRVLNYMCNLDIPKDTGDFRLITKKVVEVLKNMPEHNRFIRGMVPWVGFKSAPVEFNREERYAGETHYPLKAMIKLASNAIFSFSTKPLVMINYLAGLVLLLSIFSFLRLNLISATILFVGSLQLLAIGIVGAYIGRIYEEAKGRPLYTIKDKLNL